MGQFKAVRHRRLGLSVAAALAGLGAALWVIAAAPVFAQQAVSPGATTLTPAPADPTTPDEVQLVSRPALAWRGEASWDDGYDALTGAFARLDAEAGKADLKVTGAPLARFLQTDDQGFRFEALLPVDAVPVDRPAGLPAEFDFAETPAGKSIRFVHKAPYDAIDSTYEAIAAYLDSKMIEANEVFTEEYVKLGADRGDDALELFIYVQPK